MINRTLVKNGRKNKNISVVMFICLLFLTVVFLPNMSWAFTSATAIIEGVGSFDVIEFGQNFDQPAAGSNSGKDVAIRRLDIGSLSIQISINNQIPLLFALSASGQYISSVTVIFDGGAYSIKLYSVQVSSFHWAENQGFAGLQIDLIAAERIEWIYDGIATGWNIKRDEPL